MYLISSINICLVLIAHTSHTADIRSYLLLLSVANWLPFPVSASLSTAVISRPISSPDSDISVGMPDMHWPAIIMIVES